MCTGGASKAAGVCVGVTTVCVRMCRGLCVWVCTSGVGIAAGVCMCACMWVRGSVQWPDCTADKLYYYYRLLVGWAKVSIGS